MSLRPPRSLVPGRAAQSPLNVLDAEVMAEKAAALAHSGRKLERALDLLRAAADADRPELVVAAAKATHAYFIQRELMGFNRHAEVIERYAIPREVLARVGAS
jgi:hypothetical protein